MNLLKRIKFRLDSTNQHGVHSPFVFNYLTKCIYLEKIAVKSKTREVLIKSIAYFRYENLEIFDGEEIKEYVSQKFPAVRYSNSPADLVYTKNPNLDLLIELINSNKIHNDSMLLIEGIHSNLSSEKNWNLIIGEEKATVTIDFFHCGVIFFRREQVKEHFKIRI